MLQSIFNIVLIQSITGGLLALMIIGLKPITDKKFNALWQYYVWIVVVIWLLIPFIPDIPVFNNHAIQTIQPGISHENIFYENNPTDNNITRLAATSANIQIKLLIPWVWLSGVILFAIYYGHKYAQFTFRLKQSSLQITNMNILSLFDACRLNMGIKRNVSLHSSADIGTPILYGIFKPVITLPDVEFKADEYKMIFIHELTHYKRKDIWYKMLALVANTFHWFNPLVYFAVKNINEACEYACDEAVICNMLESERRYYGEIILNLIALQTDKKMAMSTALSSIKKIERRLDMILKFGRTKKRIMILAATGVLVLTVAGSFLSSYTGKVLGADTEVYNNSFTKSNDEKKALKEMLEFELTWDKAAVNAFSLDLNGYRKIKTIVEFRQREYSELRLADVNRQIPLKYGDLCPSVYLSENDTRGIAVTQDLKGLYTLYEFEANKDKDSTYAWKITGTKTVQGERKFINETVKDSFTKNPIPNSGDNKQQSLKTPTSKYETTAQANP